MTNEQVEKLECLITDLLEARGISWCKTPMDLEGMGILTQKIHALMEAIDTLRKLPVTKDGVIAVPGDTVYHPLSICGGTTPLVPYGECIKDAFVDVPISRGADNFINRSIDAPISECYSTAARAAAEKEARDAEGD